MHYRGFHKAHLNFQSVNNKFELLNIQVKEVKFHVFSFSESWLTERVPGYMVNIGGYNLIRWDIDNGKGTVNRK